MEAPATVAKVVHQEQDRLETILLKCQDGIVYLCHMEEDLKIQVREKCERICATVPRSCRRWLEKTAGKNNCTLSAVMTALIQKAKTMLMSLMC